MDINMNMKSIKLLNISVTFLLSLLLIISPLYAYRGNYTYTYELTFLSNFSTGIFMLIAGILLCVDKKAPQILFLDFSMLLLIVFGVTVSFSGNFNMTGDMFFLHVINPILFIAYYLIFSDQNTTKKGLVLTVLCMPVTYLIFAVFYGRIAGNYIYFFLDYNRNGVGYMCIFILGIAVGTALVGFFMYYLNRWLRKLCLTVRINS